MQSAESVGGYGQDVSESTGWPPFHWLERPEVQPILDHFWRVKYDDHDQAMYNRFLEILRLSHEGLNCEEIGRRLHMNNVRKFLTGEKKSFLTHLRAEHDRLGPPDPGHKWLPLQLKPRGTPSKAWIQVPSAPLEFRSIRRVINDLGTNQIDQNCLPMFGFESSQESQSERISLFGFFLGAVVGDASKRMKAVARFPSRAISIVLSKNKPNPLWFGEFASLCANSSLGLGMHRVSDLPVSETRFGKSQCYHWLSAASPLVSWVFNECLGLKDDETTTYDSLRMEWILTAERDFQIHFLQGVCESDGWPSAGSDTVEFVSSPNSKLFESILAGLGCRARRNIRPPVEVISVPSVDAFTLPIFNPRISSMLYRDTKILACAKQHPERPRLSPDMIEAIRRISRTSPTLSEVCLRLAEETGYKVRNMTVKKYLGMYGKPVTR